MKQGRAKLRACASCEWIFASAGVCPKCGFVSYGARYVYGDKCYRYKVTQKPWLEKKIEAFRRTLLSEVAEKANEPKKG